METAISSAYTGRNHAEIEGLLYKTAVSGACPSVETLLKGGVDVNAFSSRLISITKPLDALAKPYYNGLANTHRNFPVFGKMRPIQEPSLYVAVKKGYISIVQTILDYGGDASLAFYDTSLLHIPSKRGNLKVMEALLGSPSAPHIDHKDGLSRTPLMNAAASCHKAVVKYLLEEGASINVPGSALTRPLMGGN
jgi:hypothetical protein